MHDERVTTVLHDSAPTVILTTSAVAGDVLPYVRPAGAPTVVEIDTLDLDNRRPSGDAITDRPEIAYLQYTSGSTRAPAGVVVTHRNLAANWAQLIAGYLPDYRMPQSAVSWLP